MEACTEVRIERLIPKGATLEIAIAKGIKIGKMVEEGDKIGHFKFLGSSQIMEVKANIPGTISWIIKEGAIEYIDEMKPGIEVFCKITPCQHELVYDGVCSSCFKPCQERHAQRIFERISGVSASGKLVEARVQQLTGGNKMIMILDLDNTIIHATQVPKDFSVQEYYRESYHPDCDNEFKEYLKNCKRGDKLDDYFEVCKNNEIKYIVRKRNHLQEFLETMDQHFVIFVYTFGTRRYALEVIDKLDPEEKILKKSRLISKTDANLDYKELAKVIPGAHHDITLILDDRTDVWQKYKNNLIQVVPYYHYNDDHPNNDLRKEKLFIGAPDNYLHYLTAFLARSSILRRKAIDKGKECKVQKLVRKMHSTMFSGENISFSSFYPMGTDPTTQIEARLILQRGGRVIPVLSPESALSITTLVTKSTKNTKKIRGARETGIKVVSSPWLRYSLLYHSLLDKDFFNPLIFDIESLDNVYKLEDIIVEHHSHKKLLELAEEQDNAILASLK